MIKPSWVGNSKNIYFLPQQIQSCEANTDLKAQVFSPADHRLHWEQAESCLLKRYGIALGTKRWQMLLAITRELKRVRTLTTLFQHGNLS